MIRHLSSYMLHKHDLQRHRDREHQAFAHFSINHSPLILNYFRDVFVSLESLSGDADLYVSTTKGLPSIFSYAAASSTPGKPNI